MSDEPTTVEKRGRGRPRHVTNSDRMRHSRDRRKLERLCRRPALRGIAAIQAMMPRAIEAIQAVLDDPKHEAHAAIAKFVVQANIEIAPDIFDRTGLSKRVNFEIDATVAQITPELMQQALQAAMLEVAQDPTRGAVPLTDADFEVIPEANGTVQ